MAEPRWLSAEEMRAWQAFLAAAALLDRRLDQQLKEDAGLFVFFQGHPEYEAETLMGEYRRDVGRYLKCETETYPLLPLDYFEGETERSLREIEAKARASRQEKLLGEVSAVLNGARIRLQRAPEICQITVLVIHGFVPAGTAWSRQQHRQREPANGST